VSDGIVREAPLWVAWSVSSKASCFLDPVERIAWLLQLKFGSRKNRIGPCRVRVFGDHVLTLLDCLLELSAVVVNVCKFDPQDQGGGLNFDCVLKAVD